MGLFAVPLGDTWQEKLDSATANIKLLKDYPDGDYLWSFIDYCIEEAKEVYRKETGKEIK